MVKEDLKDQFLFLFSSRIAPKFFAISNEPQCLINEIHIAIVNLMVYF